MLSLQMELQVDSKSNLETFSLDYVTFDYNGSSLPISFQAFRATEEEGIVSIQTGYGLLFDDFELDVMGFEETYEELGLKVEDITAEFLSKLGAITHAGGICSSKVLKLKKVSLYDVVNNVGYDFKGDISKVEFDFE